MTGSFRKVLADSYVAAVAIAVFLLWCAFWAVLALERPLFSAAKFVITAIAIRGVPSMPETLTAFGWLGFFTEFSELVSALMCGGVAIFLARCVYGVGPLRALAQCGARLKGVGNV